MEDLIILVVVAVILTAAVWYLYRAKKRGTKCIGCSAEGGCPYKNGAGMCSCGCVTTSDEEAEAERKN